MVHSKIWDSDQLLSLKPLSRLLYIGMITLADDEGRLRGEGYFLKKYLFNRDRIGERKIEKMRDEIAAVGLICVYPSEKRICIAHPHWTRYQTLDKRRCKPSDFPSPPAGQSLATDMQAQPQEKVAEGSTGEDNRNQVSEARGKMLEGLSPTLRKRFERQKTEPMSA